MIKKILTYIIIIGVFVSLIWIVLEKGNKIVRINKIELTQNINNTIFSDKVKPVVINSQESVFRQFTSNIKYPLSILLLQVIIILFTSKLFGIIMRMFGQQTVIGEIIAGIFLGPSILGWLFPAVSALIFPHDSFISLQFLSQIGLAFFMFVVGMELDIVKIKNKTQDAVIISHASIIFPFFLGTCLSYKGCS